ncbi:hypothetical protein JCM3770_004580 [Rhodotorula araucariae]
MHRSRLEQLPPELLSHLLVFLPFPSLLALSATSRLLHELVITDYLPMHATQALGAPAPFTLQHLSFHRRAPVAQRALWAERTARRWEAYDGRGAMVSSWGGKCIPVVKLWEVYRGLGAVIVGKGRDLELWTTRGDGAVEVVPVVVPAPRKGAATSATDDVTALASGRAPGEIVVARHSGLVQRLRVALHGDARGRPTVLEETARYAVSGAIASGDGATSVQSLHSEGGLLAAATTTRMRPPTPGAVLPSSGASTPSLASSLSSRAAPKSHAVTLHSLAAPWQSPDVLPFASKPWAVHLSPSARWLAVGHTGTAPLSLYALDSTGSPVDAPTHLVRTPRSTSVYGLATPGIFSAFTNPEQVVLAALYDSTARVYDLRIPPPPTAGAGAGWDADDAVDARPRNEVLRLSDPWSDDASYALALGGAQGAILAVGTARNAAVRLFDLRAPTVPLRGQKRAAGDGQRRGITAFAPGKDRSPVYGLQAEGSRVWGVTDRRGFVLDFDAFGMGARGEKVAYVGHEEGGGGVLKWMGE